MPLMQVDPVTFAINLHLVIGAVLLLTVLLIAVIGIWTGIKIGLWRRDRKRAAQAEQRRKFQPDGQPYPPAGRGLCDGCGRMFDKVYHLPTGERRCPLCYERTLKEHP